MNTILLTGAADAQAYRLKQYISADFIVFADQQELPQMPSASKKSIKIPDGSSTTFAHEILSRCLDLQISNVYPLRENEVLALSEAALLFEEYGIKLIIPDLNWLKKNVGVSTYDTSNVIILKDGQIIGGNYPPDAPIPIEQRNGIFNFTFHDDEIKLTLFSI